MILVVKRANLKISKHIFATDIHVINNKLFTVFNRRDTIPKVMFAREDGDKFYIYNKLFFSENECIAKYE